MHYALQTDRLELRDVRVDDAADIFAYADGAAYNRYLPTELPTRDDIRSRIDNFVCAASRDGPRRLFQFVAQRRGKSKIVGELTLARTSATAAEIGWGVAEPYWCQGFGSETALRGLAFGFEALGLHRIEARVAPDNEGSVRMLEKLGFSLESIRRECVRARGRWWSLAQYGILSHEFAAPQAV